jgi:hypothetical protein
VYATTVTLRTVPRHPTAKHPVPCLWPCSRFRAVAFDVSIFGHVLCLTSWAAYLNAPFPDLVRMLFGIWPIQSRSERTIPPRLANRIASLRARYGARRIQHTANPYLHLSVAVDHRFRECQAWQRLILLSRNAKANLQLNRRLRVVSQSNNNNNNSASVDTMTRPKRPRQRLT